MGVSPETESSCSSSNEADLQPILGSHHLHLPVRLTPGAGWLEDLTTHRATDDQISCADLEICVNGVMRATLYVERSKLISDGQARLQVDCRLGRLSPLSMHHFRHDVIPLLHQVRTFHSPARALHSRVTTSAFFAAPEGRPDCHQDLAACHPLRTQAHIKHRAANRVPFEP